jgi:CheY-like chemotaxis protein
MRTQMKSEDHLRPHVHQVLEAADRAARLVRQLLAFSRKDALKPSFVDLSAIVRDLAPLLRRIIGGDIVLTTHLEPGLDRVWADAGQLEQVVMNLAVNARDAMPHGGRLTIVTQNAGSVERRREPRPRRSQPPHMVRLTVADTGSGMDEETLGRIWEPFFTTKDPEKGTGLGLVTVHGIVSHAGGSIQVMSRLGEGTTFHVLLPSASGQEVAEAERAVPQAAPPPRGSQETVLVVEDEDLLRDVLAAVLQEHGYSVLVAGNSQEALAVLERHPRPVQVALVDVVLPGGSGPELCRELVRRRPGLKPVYMSGRVGEEALREANAVPGPLIAKPFRPEELLEIIGGLLSGQLPVRPS